jgi:hypothetical protein
MTQLCTSAVACVYAFQPLIASVIALSAATFSAFIIWRTAHLTDRREREKEEMQLRRLRASFAMRLSQRAYGVFRKARSAEGTIRVLAASNTILSEDRSKSLRLSIEAELSDTQSMASLPIRLQKQAYELDKLFVVYNGYTSPGTSYSGADQFVAEMNRILNLIREQANALGGEMELFAKETENPLAAERKFPIIRRLAKRNQT